MQQNNELTQQISLGRRAQEAKDNLWLREWLESRRKQAQAQYNHLDPWDREGFAEARLCVQFLDGLENDMEFAIFQGEEAQTVINGDEPEDDMAGLI